MSVELPETVSWTEELEKYFASTAEKASSLSWLHKKSEHLFTKRRTYIDLPCIAGGAIIAFLNAGSSSLFTNRMDIAPIALGIGSLLVSLTNTLGSYFAFAKRAEGHRLSAIHYAKTSRFISLELRLPRAERMPAHSLVKLVTEQYERLAETSPALASEAVAEYKTKFYNNEKYKDLSVPEDANGIERVTIYQEKPTTEEILSPPPKIVIPEEMLQKTQPSAGLMSPRPNLVVRKPSSFQETGERPFVGAVNAPAQSSQSSSQSSVVEEAPSPV